MLKAILGGVVLGVSERFYMTKASLTRSFRKRVV